MDVINRDSGRKAPFECSCCGTPLQIETPPPICTANSSVEQCTCLNINDNRGRKGYNCDCNYKKLTKIKEINFPL